MSDSNDYSVDLSQLTGFGTLWTTAIEQQSLPRAHFREDAVETICQILTHGSGSRSVALLGPSGAGKSALVNSVAYRLAERGWHVLHMASADFLSGTMWLGEWQTRLNKLVTALKTLQRVVLYCPSLSELEMVGRSSSSDANVASALAPFIERGEIAIIGESTEAAFKKGLGANPSLRRLFQCVAIPPATNEETRAILGAVSQELYVQVEPTVLDRLCEFADFVNASAELPGRAVELLRRVAGRAIESGSPLRESDILDTIRATTGLPIELLDDTIPLDRVALREFFEARVMGQPDAIDAAVDLVTLMKAGLTDPQKPLGVLLFVGPTGVGKTELARAMAEYCFGEASRLLRIDMSEYATYEAYERLIGKAGEPGLLTSAVREQPFSIVLFDEFEKGHFNIFDLCLQIFDAGRLTDSQGRTTDFHRTIIVLTSNVGARVSKTEPIGFGLGPPPTTTLEQQTQRDLQRAFRPEFLNRIDRIVQFQPLTEEVAEQIARREVARVLERSGIRRRNFVIDCDPSLIPLLLREGYSKMYGARPLKRAIERLVLLPLARAIADRRIRPHSLVRLIARQSNVHLQVTPPDDAEESVAVAPAPSADLPSQLAALARRVEAFDDRTSDLSAQKSSLLTSTADADIWSRPDEPQRIYEQVYVIDGVLARADKVRKSLQRLLEAGTDSGRRRPGRVRARIEEFECRVQQAEALLNCQDAKYLGDAVVSLTLVSRLGTPLGAIERLAGMYAKFARRAQFTVAVLDDHRFESPADDTISLLVGGVGAYALLAAEAGMHVVTYGTGGDTTQQQREVVRVSVASADPACPVIEQGDVRLEIHPLQQATGRLISRPRLDVRLVHIPTATSLRAWTDGDRANVLERLLPLLRAKIQAGTADRAPRALRTPVVRRYRLGPSQLVRDLRSGRRSGRLDMVLAGHIDGFLMPLMADEPQADFG
jgi:ATP-dependent Clp protease ATP-binding subunit ClpC